MHQEDETWLRMVESGRLGTTPVIYFREISSTNLTALELVRQGAPPGAIVIAEMQTQGRGRMSRNWVSPPGAGLYFSLIVKPNIPLSDAPKMSIAVSLAICLAIEEVCGLNPRLKWPNDILLGSQKFCGILSELEMNPSVEGNSFSLVIGIGINVTTDPTSFPEEIRSRATSLLAYSGKRFARGIILKTILKKIHEVIARMEEGKFPAILADWKVRDGLKGAKLTWLTPTGNTVTGVSLGPNHNGILHIEDSNGKVHEVISGDIYALREEPKKNI